VLDLDDERPPRAASQGSSTGAWAAGSSGLLNSCFFRGELGERSSYPGKPQVPFEKVLVIGLGSRGAFGEDRFREGVLHIAGRASNDLRIRRAVFELPRAGMRRESSRSLRSPLALECVGRLAGPRHVVARRAPADQKRTELRAAYERRPRPIGVRCVGGRCSIST